MINRAYMKAAFVCKGRFHYHNARIWQYQYEDGTRQTEFWSYSTPIVVMVGDKVFYNPHKYSVTTSRQTNRFLREHFIDIKKAEIVDEGQLRCLCK